jgi:hypothetical protein
MLLLIILNSSPPALSPQANPEAFRGDPRLVKVRSPSLARGKEGAPIFLLWILFLPMPHIPGSSSDQIIKKHPT